MIIAISTTNNKLITQLTHQAYNGIGSIALWDVTLLLDFKMPEPEIRPYEPSSFNATIIRHPNEYDISGGGNGTVVVNMRPSYLPAITHTNRSLGMLFC